MVLCGLHWHSCEVFIIVRVVVAGSSDSKNGTHKVCGEPKRVTMGMLVRELIGSDHKFIVEIGSIRQ